MIPVLRPSCTQAEIDAVANVLRSGWWGNGPVCEEFERQCAEAHGYSYCVTVNSATAALHLALLALNVGPGDEVILPALTFVSTALAVTYTGATPVFADVDPRTLTIDWRDVDLKTTHNTRCVIPVDYAGYPSGDGTQDGLIVQDAAHNAGGFCYGDLACLSFHPVKPIATGDGGAILTNNRAVADKLRKLRWCGIDKNTHERTGNRYAWDYDIQDIGYKCHWDDIQAAIGLVQLARRDEMGAKRRQVAQTYHEILSGIDGIQLPRSHARHTWHLYAIRVDTDKRDEVIDALAAQGISAGVHYKPLTLYPMYAQATPPVTAREWQRLISLPIYADLTTDEAEQIAHAVIEAVRHA